MTARRLRIVAALSLALFLAIAWTWVRSYDGFRIRAHDGALVLLFIPSTGVHPEESERGMRGYFSFIERLLSTESTARQGRVLGIGYFRIPRIVSGIRVPLAYIALVPLALFVAFAMLARRQRRRERLGLCLGCGYDLRESSGKCPECGREAVHGAAG